jgi:hypothetical protein
MATCKEAVVRAQLVFAFGTTYVGKKPLFSGARIDVRDIKERDREYRDVPPELDNCGWKQDALPKQEPIIERLSNAAGGVDDAPSTKLDIGTEVCGRMSIGLGLNGVPAQFSLGYTRRCAHVAGIYTRLMPGADYLGYLPQLDNPLEQCWTVLKRGRRKRGPAPG